MLNIVVTVKQVLDPEAPVSTFKINTEAKRAVPTAGVPPVLNPYDENALEAALRIKDVHHCKVTVISLGAKLAKAVLRKCLAAGADELVLLEDDVFRDLDSYSTALILAVAIKKIGKYDLILTARKESPLVSVRVQNFQGRTCLAFRLGFKPSSMFWLWGLMKESLAAARITITHGWYCIAKENLYAAFSWPTLVKVDSTEQNPSHTYANPGAYTVSNPATSDTEIKVEYISVIEALVWG